MNDQFPKGLRQVTAAGGLSLMLALFAAQPGFAQDPPYTYQAVLEANGAPAMGPYSARFRLWDASSNGVPISPADVVAGPTPPDPLGRLNLVPRGDPWSFWRDLLCRVAQPWPPVPFGDWPTAWDPIYLEVGVKGPGEPTFTTLSPRQELTPAPLAINAVLAGRADSLKLPFTASVNTSLPAVQITQTGEGPAAYFKVQPQPEPPLPKPAIEAISAISSPAIRATNTGIGSAIEAVSNNVGPPSAPVILATHTGGGSAASLVSTGLGGNPDTPALEVRNDSTAAGAMAVYGLISSTSSVGSGSAALRGEHRGSAGVGYGVWGSHDGLDSQGAGVFGTTVQGTGVIGDGSVIGTGVLGQSVGGVGVFGNSDTGIAGLFSNNDPSHTVATLQAQAVGSGAALQASTTGTGRAGRFSINNAANSSASLRVDTSGSGRALDVAATGSGPAVYASSGGGDAIHGISTTGLAGSFEGNVHLTGNLTKAYTSGTANRAAPIAYAHVNSAGGVVSGTPNVTSILSGPSYQITIAGETYVFSSYVTVVTPVGGSGTPRLASVTSGSGKLIVTIFDPTGAPVSNSFQFVTYKP